jgi:hypothetical protein
LSALFASAHVKERHVIELPFGKQTTLFGHDGDFKHLVRDA